MQAADSAAFISYCFHCTAVCWPRFVVSGISTIINHAAKVKFCTYNRTITELGYSYRTLEIANIQILIIKSLLIPRYSNPLIKINTPIKESWLCFLLCADEVALVSLKVCNSFLSGSLYGKLITYRTSKAYILHLKVCNQLKPLNCYGTVFL